MLKNNKIIIKTIGKDMLVVDNNFELKIKEKLNVNRLLEFFMEVFAECVIVRYRAESKKKKLLESMKNIREMVN